jgi:hypothetical protein
MRVTARSAAAEVLHTALCAARIGNHEQDKHACVLCNRAGVNCLNRALRRCRPPRSLPDAQEDIERLLCGFVQGRPDAAALRRAGTPPRALAVEPLDDRAQPSAIPEVCTRPSAEFVCLSQHDMSLPTVLSRPAHACTCGWDTALVACKCAVQHS